VLDLRDGISRNLAKAFPNCTIFGDERVRQGLKTPSFFVGLGEYSTKPLPSGLIEIKQHVELIYFPETEGDHQELWHIGHQALTCLEQIPLQDGSRTRGNSRRYWANDGLLHIHATYRLRVKETTQIALMGHMKRQTTS